MTRTFTRIGLRSMALLAVSVTFGAGPAFAALSPWYDRAEQVQTLLASDVLQQQLGGQPLDGIEHEGVRADGAQIWDLDTAGCDLTVHLIPQPPEDGMVGKTTYQLELPLPACK